MIEKLLRSVNDVVIGIDLSGKVIFWNKAAENLYGYLSSEILGKHFKIVCQNKKANDFEDVLEMILFNEKVDPLESKRIRKEGTGVLVLASFSPIYDDEGKIEGVSSIEREIPDSWEVKSRSKALIETAPDAMVIVNQFGQIILINAQTEKLFGYTRGELLGEKVEILIPGRFSAHHKGHRTKFFGEPKARSMGTDRELLGKRKDGSEFSVEVSLSPLKTEQGLFVSAAIRDITERKKAEDKFRGLLESAPDAMVIVNNKGEIQLVNAQTEKLFGYKREDLYGKKVEVLIPDRFKKNHPGKRGAFFHNPKTRGMGEGIELYGLKSNGEEFPIEISLSPLETGEGRIVSAAIRDITERKKAEDKFRGLLESAPDAMVIVNQKGEIQLVNAQTENLFAYKREELLGKKVEILIPERYKGNHHNHRGSFFANPKAREMGEGMELFGLKSNGDEFPIEISLSPLETEDGIIVSAAIRDITERKADEKRLSLFNKELQGKNEELQQFAYIASHDLQEPLRTVVSFVELLKEENKGNLTEETATYISFITEASTRMSELIKGLLNYSRIGKNRSDLEQVDMNVKIKHVLDDLSLIIKEKNAIFKIDKLPLIKGYPEELRQLIQNLISNSIKFQKEGVIPSIKISYQEFENEWHFSIQDNGIGIIKEHQEKIFLIFQRIYNRDTFEGTGIGLAHCKKIAELHDGKIWVKSTIGKGSTFTFSIAKK